MIDVRVGVGARGMGSTIDGQCVADIYLFDACRYLSCLDDTPRSLSLGRCAIEREVRDHGVDEAWLVTFARDLAGQNSV